MPWQILGRHRTDPVARLTELVERSATRVWTTNEPAGDLERLGELASGMVAIAQAEIDYYLRQRSGRRLWAVLTRLIAYVSGSIGVLTPLVLAAEPTWTVDKSWGFVFLALGGAAMLGNRLFGATEGHIRYVTAQFDLEALISEFTLNWEAWKARAKVPTAQEVSEAFLILEQFRSKVFKVLIGETGKWAADVRLSEGKFSKSLAR